MEPMSLWMCSCEVLTPFWRESCINCWLLAGSSHVSSCCCRVSHRFSVGLRSQDNAYWQHLLTSSLQGKCGLVNRGCVFSRWTVVLSHSDLLHNFISAPHDIVELGKLSVASFSGGPQLCSFVDMAWVDISPAGPPRTSSDPQCECQVASFGASLLLMEHKTYFCWTYFPKMFLFHQYI